MPDEKPVATPPPATITEEQPPLVSVSPIPAFRAVLEQIQSGNRDKAKLNDLVIKEGTKPDLDKNEEVPDEKPKPEPKEEKAEPEPEKAPEKPAEDKVEPEPQPEPEKPVESLKLSEAGKPEEERAQPKEPDEVDPNDPDLKLDEKDSERYRRRAAKWEKLVEQSEKRAKAIEAKAAEAQKQLDELKAKAGTVPEDVQAKLDRLTQYEYRYNLESSPEIRERFDARIEAAEQAAVDVLKNNSLEFVAQEAAKDGGIAAMARSRRKVTYTHAGEKKTATAAELLSDALTELEKGGARVDAATIESQIATQDTLRSEKKRFLDERSAKAKEYFDAEAKQREQSTSAWKVRMESSRNLAKTFAAEAAKKLDWLRDETVPTDSKQAVDVKARNKQKAELRKTLENFAGFEPLVIAATAAQTPEEQNGIGYLLLDAVRAKYNDKEVERLTKQLESLKSENEALKGASVTTPRVGSTGSGGTPATKKTDARPDPSWSLAQIMEWNQANPDAARKIAGRR